MCFVCTCEGDIVMGINTFPTCTLHTLRVGNMLTVLRKYSADVCFVFSPIFGLHVSFVCETVQLSAATHEAWLLFLVNAPGFACSFGTSSP